jgi:hypothetical protein
MSVGGFQEAHDVREPEIRRAVRGASESGKDFSVSLLILPQGDRMNDLGGPSGTREEKTIRIHEPGVWRDRIAAFLLVVAATGAIGACIATLLSGDLGNPALQVPLIWQATGYIVFAGLFLLLADAPRAYPGVWELCIFQKGAMAIASLVFIALGNTGAVTVLWVDGVLFVMLVIAYMLSRGFTAWSRFRHL